MGYRLIYHPDILKYDLPKIPKDKRDTIRRAIEERLSTNPAAYGDTLRQSLKGYRKLRVGDYRIIYGISGDEIVILKIGHRKEVYLQVLPRTRWNLK